MKKALLKFNSSFIQLPETTNMGDLLNALAASVVYTENGWGESARYEEVASDGFQVLFVDDAKFTALTAPEEFLIKDAAEKSNQWLREYSDHQETKKKLVAAEKQLAAIKATAAEA